MNTKEKTIDLKNFASECANNSDIAGPLRMGLKFEKPLPSDKLFCLELTLQHDPVFYYMTDEYLGYSRQTNHFKTRRLICNADNFLETKDFYYGEQRLTPQLGDTIFFDSRKLRKGFKEHDNPNCALPHCMDLKRISRLVEFNSRRGLGIDEKAIDFMEISQTKEDEQDCLFVAYRYLDNFFNHYKGEPGGPKNQTSDASICFRNGIPPLYFGTTRVNFEKGKRVVFDRKEIRSIL